jgi:hypothetical protein
LTRVVAADMGDEGRRLGGRGRVDWQGTWMGRSTAARQA